MKEVKEKAEERLNQMNVETAKDRFPSDVSDGKAQRAAIARAMINHPSI